MLIAVSQRTHCFGPYQEEGDHLDSRWYGFFQSIGITPLLIPNDHSLAEVLLRQIPIQGVLLTGGDDNKERMATENELIDFALSRKLPLAGVCHGMQMIQRYFGVQLLPCTGHVANEQKIKMNGKKETVNSYHTLGSTESVAELRIIATATDGIVKAVRHISYPCVGIMWHPERLNPYAQRDIQLFKEIFS